MTDIIFFLIMSLIAICIYVLWNWFIYLLSLKKYNRMIMQLQFTNRIISLHHSFHSNLASFEKHPELQSYVSGIDKLYQTYLTQFDKLHFQKIGYFDPERKDLIFAFKAAPKYLKYITAEYSTLLCDIYKFKYPFSFFYDNAKTTFFTIFLKALIVFSRLTLRIIRKTNSMSSTSLAFRTARIANHPLDELRMKQFVYAR